jgi:hypothetical protein
MGKAISESAARRSRRQPHMRVIGLARSSPRRQNCASMAASFSWLRGRWDMLAPRHDGAPALSSSGRNLLLANTLPRRGQRVETDMIRGVLKSGAVLALLLASSAGSYADDPTGILLQERGQQPTYPGRLPRFTDGGPCYKGMHQQAFPNAQGYRCYRNDVR